MRDHLANRFAKRIAAVSPNGDLRLGWLQRQQREDELRKPIRLFEVGVTRENKGIDSDLLIFDEPGSNGFRVTDNRCSGSSTY